MFTRREIGATLLALAFPRRRCIPTKIRPSLPTERQVIIISAPWCPPCQELKKHLHELEQTGWIIGRPGDTAHIIVANPDTNEGWAICKALKCIGDDGAVMIPRMFVLVDGIAVGGSGIHRESKTSPWKLTDNNALLTAGNLADWINGYWSKGG